GDLCRQRECADTGDGPAPRVPRRLRGERDLGGVGDERSTVPGPHQITAPLRESRQLHSDLSIASARRRNSAKVLGSMSEPQFDQFQGTKTYIASEELRHAVNVAVALGRPLLVRGEPGTGKTLLAENLAAALGLDLIRWHVKSTTKAKDGLYVYDTVARLHDPRFAALDGGRDVRDIAQYIKLGPLGEALAAPSRVVLLIDEIDKADIEFPNDLLLELDAMRFHIAETGEEVVARERPFVLITSNNEKELPDAFLRRCVFQYID